MDVAIADASASGGQLSQLSQSDVTDRLWWLNRLWVTSFIYNMYFFRKVDVVNILPAL